MGIDEKIEKINLAEKKATNPPQVQQKQTVRERRMTEPTCDMRKAPLTKSGARKRRPDDLMRCRTLSISFDPINLNQQVKRRTEDASRLHSAFLESKKLKIESTKKPQVHDKTDTSNPKIVRSQKKFSRKLVQLPRMKNRQAKPM